MAAKRLTVMGFKRKAMSTNLYIRRRKDTYVVVYAYVDDYIFAGNNTEELQKTIIEFRQAVIDGNGGTTEPSWNPRVGKD
jgi:hypothetical protein